MEKAASIAKQQERFHRVYKPQYTEMQELDTDALHELLSNPTAGVIEGFIEDTIENVTITELSNSFRRQILGLTCTVGTFFATTPFLFTKGSMEEIASATTTIALSLYFSTQMYKLSSKIEYAEESQNLPKYHPVTNFLPKLYRQLALHMYERLSRIERTLCALSVHDTCAFSSRDPSKHMSTHEMHELFTSIRHGISDFSEVMMREINALEDRIQACKTADALPGMINSLLRSSWRSWKDIDEQVERLEKLLNIKKLDE